MNKKNLKELEGEIAKIEAQLIGLVEDGRVEENILDSLKKTDTYQKAETSLYDFLVGSWTLFNGNQFQSNWHINCICDHLQALLRGDLHDLLITIPPRCAKSSICSVVFPVWAWLQDPTIQFMTASYNKNLSIRDSVRSRQIIQSPWFQERWSDRFSLVKDINQKSKYQNNKTGIRQAGSVGGGDQLGEGYDILIVDDAHKAIEAHSKVARDNVIDWWTGTITTRNNSIDSKRIVIMQRLHEDDLAGQILRSGGWTHINLPMYYDPNRVFFSPIGWKDPRKEEGDILWKDRFPPSEINKWISQLGEYGVASQLQQNPVPLGGGIIKQVWLQYYDIPIPRATYSSYTFYASWDLTFGEDGTSFTVGQVWAVSWSGQKHLIHQVRGKWDITNQIHQIRRMIQNYPIRGLLIEEYANGNAVIDLLKKELKGKVNIISINPKDYGGEKKIRCIACVPEFEAGNIYLPSPQIASWVTEYVHELTMFPRGSNDDQVDATTQFLNWLFNNNSKSRSIQYNSNTLRTLDLEEAYRTNPSLYTPLKKESTSFFGKTPSIKSSRNIFTN